MTLPVAIPINLPVPFRFPKPRFPHSICLIFSCNAISQSAEDAEDQRQRCRNAMKQFLVKECLISPSQLPAIMRKDPVLFRRISTRRAQEAVELFRDSAFTPDQVSQIIYRHPHVLAFKVDEKLKPKIDFFRTLGLNGQDLGSVLSRQPRILTFSLEKNLAPKIPLLVGMFGSKDNLSKAMKRVPGLLSYEVETLVMKVKNMESIGLHKQHIKDLLNKDPRFLTLSMDKIQKNMYFLTHTVGFQPNIVVQYPHFLNFSVEKRMRPRHKVFEYLTATRSSEYLTMSLVRMLALSEGQFEEKFLRGSPHVAELYEKCKGKPVDTEIT